MKETPRPALVSQPDDDRADRLTRLTAMALDATRANFDPARHLVGHASARDAAIRTYRPPQALPLARALLDQGDPASLAEAASIIAAVLDSQERDPAHPYYGNFLWLADDAEVCDLNAVQFVLQALLPVLTRHGHRLAADLQARCRDAVRLALAEEERLDVAPTYTNIHLMSLFALLVGGEWLGDAHFLALGRQRWARWVRFTVESGAPHEYNSPGYGAVDLGTLATLQDCIHDPAVRLQARLLYERLWLHLALHLHCPTGQHAGPHCRCYWGPMMTGQGSFKEVLWRETGWDWLLAPGPYGGRSDDTVPTDLALALTPHWLPETVRLWLEHQTAVLPYTVRETANREIGADLTTYLTSTYALGTASRTYGIGQDDYYIEHQANYLLLYYRRAGSWAMMYSRYVVNDQHWGTLAAASDRSPYANFYDQGHFAGAQVRNKAIALYALMPQHTEVFSLKTVIVLPNVEHPDEVWVEGQRVRPTDLPAPVPAGAWIGIADGDVYIGLRPLEPSRLGREAPIVLERGPQGELWLTIVNYQGAPKRFWDYASLGGAFWRGNLRAGYIVEVADRTVFPSVPAFLAHLRQAVVTDTVDDDRIRSVTYRSGDDELRLRYDLGRTEPLDRHFNGQLDRAPALASPLAVQGSTGVLQVGQATLRTAPQPVWLIVQEVDPAYRAWIAVNPEDQPSPLRLETPGGVVTATSWGLGRIEWRLLQSGESELWLDGPTEPAGLAAPAGVTVRRRHS